jgi:replication factor C subunit 3/5
MIPWIEKYRPDNINNIQFNNINKIIFDNIVNTLFLPNLILYGPPGTGKTTTIICLFNKLKKLYNIRNTDIIHLNASDERGVDTIRNTIYTFIHSYNSNYKYIILDEVDSMTILAQNSLVNLLNNKNVKFCLICNYLSKLINEIKDSCTIIRFTNNINYNQYLNQIIKQEKLKISDNIVNYIIYVNRPDLRYMINNLESYKYNHLDYIPIKDIQQICKLNHYYINKYKKYNLKHLFDYLFLYIIDNFQYNSILIDYMENLMNNPDFDYFKNVFLKYFSNIQN